MYKLKFMTENFKYQHGIRAAAIVHCNLSSLGYLPPP